MKEFESDLRIPNNFIEYHGEEIMSNFDGKIVRETEYAIKGKELYSRYAGWNFNGKVWWNNNKWCCEVFVYGSFKETIIEDSLEDIMIEVSSKYGYE